MTTQKNKFLLKGLKLDLFLGWEKEERLNKQAVLVDILLNFKKRIPACKTDNLKDTICYFTLINMIKEKTIDKEFKLVEKLAEYIYNIVNEITSHHAFVKIIITKHPASLPELTGGVLFEYGDE